MNTNRDMHNTFIIKCETMQSRMFFIFSDVDGVDENGDDDDSDDDDLDDVLEDDEVGDNQDNSDELAAALANVNI